jgi:hypothetical protein
MTAANQPERNSAIKCGRARQRSNGPARCIGQRFLVHSRLGHWPRADESVLGLEKNIHTWRYEIGHQGRDSDSEIDEHARAKLLRDAFCDNGLSVHNNQAFATR